MRTSKIFFGLILGIFFIASVSAVSVSWGQWSDGSTSMTITQGQSASFNYQFNEFFNPPMSMSINMYDSSGNIIYNFLDNSTSDSTYYNTIPIEVNSSVYKNPGKYDLVFYSNDAGNSPSAVTLTLTVNPAPANTAPTLNLIPNQTVNENASYSYQMNATDSDGDALTYSLPNAPSWLSIDPSTGLIIGTTPNVTADTNYTIEAGVSDGVNSQVTQNYTLTVKNVLSPTTPDTTAPTISLTSPPDGYITNQSLDYFYGIVSDNVAVSNVSILLNNVRLNTSYSGLNNSNYSFPLILADGIYNWSYKACDTSGNCATSPERKIIIDTKAPTINFGSSTTSGNVSQNFIYLNVSASDEPAGVKNLEFTLYNSTGTVQLYSSLSNSISMNITNLADGTYYLNATAEDNAGNKNTTATRTIVLDTTPPTIQFVSPTPSNSSSLNQTYIPANMTVSDSGTGVKNQTIYLYSSSGLVGTSSSNFANFTNLADGTYYLNATAYDILGNFQATPTIKITLNNSITPTPQPSQSSSQNNGYNYSYYDPSTQQYQNQLNQTSPGISLTSGESPSLSNGAFWVWALILGIIIVLVLVVFAILGRTRLNKKYPVPSGNDLPEKAAVLY